MNRKAKRKADKKRIFVYIRYLFPVFSLFVTVISMFIPCYLYTTSAGVSDKVYSLSGLVGAYWKPVCDTLFRSTGEIEPATLQFSKNFMIVFVIGVVLFTVAAISTVYVTVNAFKYFNDPKDKSNSRMLFLTLTPNRIVVSVLQLLSLPLLFFPRYMVILFKNILHEPLTITLTFAEPIIIGVALYVICIILYFVSVSVERDVDMDPFKKHITRIEIIDGEDEYYTDNE